METDLCDQKSCPVADMTVASRAGVIQTDAEVRPKDDHGQTDQSLATAVEVRKARVDSGCGSAPSGAFFLTQK